MTSAIIIGSGMGGLATALRLQYQGFDVTVLEKLSRIGGRSNVIIDSGYRMDMGPTILVMKDIFEATYQAIGRDINESIDFVQLDPNYRIYFHDNTYIDLHARMSDLAAEIEKVEPGATEKLFHFIGEGARKYELGMPFVTRNYERITDLMNPGAGWKLLRTGSFQKLFGQVSRYFKTDKLQKAFSFHSMFLGLSPYDALAMYGMITYADLALGMWFPCGGTYALIEDMERIANELGVSIRTDAPVSQILIENGTVKGVQLESGETVHADMVISNADLPYTYKNLVPKAYQGNYTPQKLDKMDYACSGYLIYLGIDKQYPNMQHQALYFSDDYQANLDAIFKNYTLPEDPSFHLNNPTLTDPSLAPDGHSLLYILAPMPNLSADIDWDVAAPKVRNQLLDQLEHLIDPEIRQHIVWQREFTPNDFKTRYNAELGTAFGSLSQGFFQSSYFRPHNKARNVNGLYFVGQGTYPGIGMPMVLYSAQLVTEKILEEWQP